MPKFIIRRKQCYKSMKLHLEPDVVIPLGITGKFLSKWDEDLSDEDDDDSEFEFELFYLPELLCDPIDCKYETEWREMSYNRLTENSLTR
jgi:hypothetical protein